MDTAHTTKVYGAPEGWNEDLNGPCAKLPVIDEYGAGVHVITTIWKPTWQERFGILFGKPIALTLHGMEVPCPMNLYMARILRKHYRRRV